MQFVAIVLIVSWVDEMPDLPLSVCLLYVRSKTFSQDQMLNGLGQQTAYTLICVIEGSAMVIGEQEYIAREGECLLTQPGQKIKMNKGTRVAYACFDITCRARDYKVSKNGFLLISLKEGASVQPSWLAVAETDIPVSLGTVPGTNQPMPC